MAGDRDADDAAAAVAPADPAAAAAQAQPGARQASAARADGAGAVRGSTAPAVLGGGRVSASEAEQVIARAIELQEQADGRPRDGLTAEDLHEIAAAVGVSPQMVQRALLEVRRAPAPSAELSLTERLLGPERVGGAAVVPAPVHVTQRAAERWMVEDEGLRVIGIRGDTMRLTKDARVIAGLRSGLGVTRGEGSLRGMSDIRVDVTEDPAGARVSVTADSTAIRRTSGGLAVGGILAGIGAGVAAAAVVPETAAISSDIAQFAVTATATAGVGVGIAATVARQWTRKVRRAIDVALDGISLSAERPGGGLPPLDGGGWRDAARRWLGG